MVEFFEPKWISGHSRMKSVNQSIEKHNGWPLSIGEIWKEIHEPRFDFYCNALDFVHRPNGTELNQQQIVGPASILRSSSLTRALIFEMNLIWSSNLTNSKKS